MWGSLALKRWISAMGEISKWLKKERIAAGYTRHQLGRRLNLSYSYLSLIENGHATPGKETLKRMARVFSVDVYHLMFLAGKMPDDLSCWIMDNPAVQRRLIGEFRR